MKELHLFTIEPGEQNFNERIEKVVLESMSLAQRNPSSKWELGELIFSEFVEAIFKFLF